MDAMRTVISLKEQINQDLAAENQRLKEDYEKKLAYIKDEAAQKHTHILALTAQVERKDRAIFWLVFALIALLAIIIIALIVDRINPDLGYFWRNMAAVLGGDDVSGPGLDSAGSLILFARSAFRFLR